MPLRKFENIFFALKIKLINQIKKKKGKNFIYLL